MCSIQSKGSDGALSQWNPDLGQFLGLFVQRTIDDDAALYFFLLLYLLLRNFVQHISSKDIISFKFCIICPGLY